MCSTFWPLKRSEPKEFNNITVCLEETDEQESYNTYRLIVTLTVRGHMSNMSCHVTDIIHSCSSCSVRMHTYIQTYIRTGKHTTITYSSLSGNRHVFKV